MKKLLIFASIAISMQLMLFTRVIAADEPRQHLVISGMQTGSTASASNEYIKIYNPNASEVSLEGWQVQYQSASGKSGWAKVSSFACGEGAGECQAIAPAQSEVLLASYDITGRNYLLSSGMAATGGQLRLVSPNGKDWVVEDMVGYGTSIASESNQPAPAPKPADALIRRVDPQTKQFIDTDNNGQDFVLESSLTPAGPASPSGSTSGSDTSPSTTVYLPLLITELLPDPVSPATDANDEFVELYNPNGTTLDIKGYVLQAGTNWRYKFNLPDTSLAPGAFATFYSRDTKIALSNSGAQVRILDPTGVVTDQTPSYGTAKSGQSWMSDGEGVWQWTTTPTPGSANIITIPGTVTKAPAKAATPKTTKSTTTTAKKPASTTSKSSSSSAAPSAAPKPSSQPTSDPLMYWLIAGAVLLVVGYGTYEYRRELVVFMHRLYARVRRRPRTALSNEAETC